MKKKKSRTILSYKKRLRDSSENPKKKWCAAGCERTEKGKFFGQKEEQKRQILWFTEFMVAPQSHVWTFVGENYKTYQVGRENKRLDLLPGKSTRGVKNELCENIHLSVPLYFLGP